MAKPEMVTAKRAGIAAKIMAAAQKTLPSTWENRLQQAIELYKSFPRDTNYEDVRGARLTAKATLAAAMAAANTDAKRLAALDERLTDIADHPLIDRLLAIVHTGYRTTDRGKGAFIEPPAAATFDGRLGGPERAYAVKREAKDFGTSIQELIALGIKRAAEDSELDDCWGTVSDLAIVEDNRRRFTELCADLDSQLPQNEYELRWIEKSIALVVYKRAPRIGVREGAAALVEFLVNQKEG